MGQLCVNLPSGQNVITAAAISTKYVLFGSILCSTPDSMFTSYTPPPTTTTTSTITTTTMRYSLWQMVEVEMALVVPSVWIRFLT